MNRPRPKTLILSAAALALAGLRESARFTADGAEWVEPGGPAALAAGGALLAFWATGACLAGREAALKVNAGAHRVGLVLWSFLYAYLFVLLSVAALGAAGWINAIGLTILSALPVLACSGATRERNTPDTDTDTNANSDVTTTGLVAFLRQNPLAAIVIAVVGGLTLANVAWSFILPPFAHDDFTYHLVFPVEWMQSGTLTARAVPFGNHSPPYYPMNTELFYLWLLLPFRAVFHVTAAQSVFLLFSVVALYEIFRKCGASRRAAAMAAALFCLSPVVVAELSKAYVDVAFGCFFLIALNAALAFHHAPSGGKTLQFAIALGIFAGTKMPGLVFSLLILLPLFAVLLFSASRRGARTAPVCPGRVAALLAAGCALFLAAGGWWYVRNLLATGNPVFPLNVDLFGISFFEGAYDRSALPPSNVTTLLDLHTPHFLWLLSAGALLTAGAALLARDGKGLARRALLFGLLLPAAMAAIFHGLLPFDYARFVLALCGLAGALLLVPLDSRHGRWAGIALLAVLTAAFLCNEERGKLLLPLLEARLLSTWQVWLSFAAVIAAGLCSALLLLFRWPRPWKTLLAILLALAAFGAFEAGGIVADAEGPFFIEAFRKSREPYIFLDRNYGNVTVAYSGTNRSFLLYGGNLANRVCHVNVNRCPGWLFHDYVQRFTGDRSARRKDRNGVAYTRSDARYPAWAANLDSAGADLLFVERLTPWNLEKSYRRDGQGFPLEAIWADGHPGKFKRVFASPVVRIYEILP